MAAVAAAAVVGICVRPSARGEGRQYLLAGRLHGGDPSAPPSVSVAVDDDGSVILTRRGIAGHVHASGALSLVVNVAGLDISVEERLTPGHADDGMEEPAEATFVLDFLGPEHYHLKYYAESIDGLAAMPLHVRPGIKIDKPLI